MTADENLLGHNECQFKRCDFKGENTGFATGITSKQIKKQVYA